MIDVIKIINLKWFYLKAFFLLEISFSVSTMYNCWNFAVVPSGSKLPILWHVYPRTRNTYGPQPISRVLLIFPPIDVNANIMLYPLMRFIKRLLHKSWPCKRDESNCGGSWRIESAIFPFLQHNWKAGELFFSLLSTLSRLHIFAPHSSQKKKLDLQYPYNP